MPVPPEILADFEEVCRRWHEMPVHLRLTVLRVVKATGEVAKATAEAEAALATQASAAGGAGPEQVAAALAGARASAQRKFEEAREARNAGRGQ